MARNLLRNARLFVSTVGGASPTLDKGDTWEILIQDDLSFTQATETQEITVAETGATPVRGQAVFNTALNPVEWSFSTYIRPYIIATGGTNADEHRCIEAILWHALVSPNDPDFAAAGNAECRATSTTSFDINFSASNVHVLKTLFIYIKLDDTTWYRINNVQVNQAEIDLGIDGIGMITWSGNGTTLEKLSSAPTLAGTLIQLSGATPSETATEADYVVTKLSTLTFEDNDGTPASPYTIPFTGGTLTINNNVTYLTPNTLSIVDTPIGSFTGTRQISGNVTCYLNSNVALGSGGLLTDMLADFSKVKNSYDITLSIGNPTATAPRVVFNLPTAQLSIPSIESADVIGLSIDFFGQGSTSPIDDTDEMSVKYVALTATTDTDNTE